MQAGTKVAVLGLGKSGIAAARFFRKRGYEVFVSDNGSPQGNRFADEIRNLRIPCEWGKHSSRVLEADLILVSPGVDAFSPILRKARKRKIPIWPEIEAAYRFCPGPMVAITGTNGKSTVTALTGHLMKTMGRDARVVGNIGKPLLDEIDSMSKETWAVMEVSSFQLETILEFHPKISCVITLTQDHLNRHEGREDYIAAKANIFKNQTKQDIAVLNQEDLNIVTLSSKTKAKILWFSRKPIEEGIFLQENSILYREKNAQEVLAVYQKFSLPGEHNLQNLAAASAICFASGLRNFGKGIETFPGLPHRLELIREIYGIRFYDDSKGTNPDAVAGALCSFRNPVLLIAGGVEKNLNFTPMVEAAKEKVKTLIVLGKEQEKFGQAFSFLPDESRISAQTMEQAVKEAFARAKPGDVILLSPGCASFDLFQSAEERGEEFQSCVKAL